MPYFRKNGTNILFIHIPKTGGTSVEQYFINKLGISSSEDCWYSINKISGKISDQHKTLRSIIKNKSSEINFKNLMILTVVRNPYYRTVSDLFFYGMIHVGSTQEEVCKVLVNYFRKYICGNTFDNHIIPQYLFLCDSSGKINKNIIILKTESLTNEMHNLGFNDFDIHKNASNAINHMNYLNSSSIQCINYVYKKDFQLFGYEMII